MKFESFPIAGEVYLIGYFIALILSLGTTLLLIKIPFNCKLFFAIIFLGKSFNWSIIEFFTLIIKFLSIEINIH